MQDRQSFALNELDRVLGFFPRVEGKATFLFAVVVAMLGTVAAKFPVDEPCSIEAASAALAAALLAASMWRIYQALFPHLDGVPRPSLLFFGDIAKLPEGNYTTRLKQVSSEEIVADAASQIWRNSEILAIKFARVRAAFRWALISLVPWLAFLALVAVRDGAVPSLKGS